MYEKYWNPKIETLSQKEIIALQEKKLRSELKYVYERSPFYHRKFDEARVKPDDIRTLEDFKRKVPFTNKEELRGEMERTDDPFGRFLCVPKKTLARVVSSTGTTGTPSFGAFTQKDLEIHAECGARSFYTSGYRAGETALVAGIRWHGGMPNLDGGPTKVGCMVIQTNCLTLEMDFSRNFYTIKELKPDRVYFPYLFLMTFTDYVEAQGISHKELFSSVKCIVSGGDIIVQTIKKKLEAKYGCPIYEFAGCSDVYEYYNECSELHEVEPHAHFHAHDDLFLHEMVDPSTGETIGPGEKGELVYTGLETEAFPTIRWRSDDICVAHTDSCVCGRTHTRVVYLGRKDFELNIRGKFVYPADVEEIMRRHPETENGIFQMIRYEPSILDKLKLRVAYIPERTKDLTELKERLTSELRKEFSVDTEIDWIKPEEVRTMLHKIVRFLDLTKEGS